MFFRTDQFKKFEEIYHFQFSLGFFKIISYMSNLLQERKKYFISTLHAPFKNIWGFREINLHGMVHGYAV
jgi:hypothetical protein